MSDINNIKTESLQQREGESNLEMIKRITQENELKDCAVILQGDDTIYMIDVEGNVTEKDWKEIRREALRRNNRAVMIAADIPAGRLHFPLPTELPCVPSTPFKNYSDGIEFDKIYIDDLVQTINFEEKKKRKPEKVKQSKPKSTPLLKFQKPQFRNTNMRGKR